MGGPGAHHGPIEVLVVNGDEEGRREIRRAIEQGNVSCREARDAARALREIRLRRPDLVAIDLYLPDQSGLGLCRTIRETPELQHMPLIVVSAQASEIDRVLAFESGVDDFVARPFHPAELRARVEAVLRGFASEPQGRPVRSDHGVVSVDPRSGRALVGGRSIDFTAKEFALFSELVAQAGRVVRRRHLLDRLWGSDAPRTDRAIDAHIKSMRRKLDGWRDCIETVRGVGYRFVEPEGSHPSGGHGCEARSLAGGERRSAR